MFELESEFCGVFIAQMSNGGNNRVDPNLQIRVKNSMPCVKDGILCVHKILCFILNSSHNKKSVPSGLRKVYYYEIKLFLFPQHEIRVGMHSPNIA